MAIHKRMDIPFKYDYEYDYAYDYAYYHAYIYTNYNAYNNA